VLLREVSSGLILALLLLPALGTPAAGAPEEPPPEAVVGDLPFLDGTSPSAIFLDLAPEGSARALSLQLDTGANTTVLTPPFARSLGVNVRSLKSSPYRRRTRLGRDLLFQVSTGGSDQSARFAPFDYGLLGGDFLDDYVVELDYAARRVRFLDPERWSVPETTSAADAAVLPFQLVGARPVVEVRLDGEPVKMLLDTGSPVGVIVGGRTAKTLVGETRPLRGFQMFGVHGEIAAQLAEARQLGLGPFTIENQPLIVAPRGLYQQGTASDSVIGHDLLALFTVRIDYPKRRLWLRRKAPLEGRLLGLDWAPARASGALLERRDDHVWVRFVAGGSAADRLGLAPNDLVEFLDAAPPPEDLAAVQAAISGGSVAVRVQRRGEDGRWQPRTLQPPGAAAPDS
jgi:predicted aspartyl protease